MHDSEVIEMQISHVFLTSKRTMRKKKCSGYAVYAWVCETYMRKQARNNCVHPRNAAVIDYGAVASAMRNLNGFTDVAEANVNETV